MPVDPSDVFFCWMSDGSADTAFMRSLLKTLGSVSDFSWGDLDGGPTVPQNRNECVRGLLRTDKKWLLFLDADAVFEPSEVTKLFEVAHPVKRPIVGGMAVGFDENTRDVRPTLYFWDANQEHPGPVFKTILKWTPGTVLQVGATGCHCLLVHRSVFEKMEPVYGNAFPWFAFGTQANGELPMGEDLTFCQRATELGFPIFVHTGAKFGHRKSIVVSVDDYEMPQEA